MKHLISVLLLMQMYTSGFSQNLNYEIRGAYKHAIKKEKIYHAKTMGDIIPYYPSKWIASYISIEVSANFDGKKK
ncbi:MAG: hypothetical protein IPO92_16880 [Saprospiraceae bacterium]|nr:hypothetical protein [Saprospiraceae bacterium]